MRDNKEMMRIEIVGVLVIALLLSGCDQVNLPTTQQMLINATQSYPSIWRMLTAFSYILGMGFIFRGVYALKVYGDMRSMMSQGPSIKTSLIMFLIGAALMFSPTTFHIVMNSTFGYPDAESVFGVTSGNSSWSSESLTAVMQLIQVVGVISFIRGWVMLSRTGGGGQSSVGKALTHIIGGLLAVNIEGTKQMLEGTFGIN